VKAPLQVGTIPLQASEDVPELPLSSPVVDTSETAFQPMASETGVSSYPHNYGRKSSCGCFGARPEYVWTQHCICTSRDRFGVNSTSPVQNRNEPLLWSTIKSPTIDLIGGVHRAERLSESADGCSGQWRNW